MTENVFETYQGVWGNVLKFISGFQKGDSSQDSYIYHTTLVQIGNGFRFQEVNYADIDTEIFLLLHQTQANDLSLGICTGQ